MVWCIAHRGDKQHFPENTHAAFESALVHPIDGIELDVRITADDHLVVFHDPTPLHFGGQNIPIAQHTLAQLHTLDAGGGESIPLLDDVLARYAARTRLLIEIKADTGSGDVRRQRQLLGETLNYISRRDLSSQVMVLCFDGALLEFGNRHHPKIPMVLNQDSGEIVDAEYLSAFSVNIEMLTPQTVATAHGLGKPVYTFTCNSRAQIDAALTCGVDGIMTDDPGTWYHALK